MICVLSLVFLTKSRLDPSIFTFYEHLMPLGLGEPLLRAHIAQTLEISW